MQLSNSNNKLYSFIAQIVKEEGLSPKRRGLDSSRESFSSDSRPKMAKEDKSIAKGKKYKLDRIQSFYDKHSRGPAKLAEKIIIAYSELKIKENGLQNTFEDFQNEVMRII